MPKVWQWGQKSRPVVNFSYIYIYTCIHAFIYLFIYIYTSTYVSMYTFYTHIDICIYRRGNSQAQVPNNPGSAEFTCTRHVLWKLEVKRLLWTSTGGYIYVYIHIQLLSHTCSSTYIFYIYIYIHMYAHEFYAFISKY